MENCSACIDRCFNKKVQEKSIIMKLNREEKAAWERVLY